jgi:hypothetical protein
LAHRRRCRTGKGLKGAHLLATKSPPIYCGNHATVSPVRPALVRCRRWRDRMTKLKSPPRKPAPDPTPAPPPEWPIGLVDETEAARLLGISIGCLRDWRCRRRVDGPRWVKAGRLVRYSGAELWRWVNRNTQPSAV